MQLCLVIPEAAVATEENMALTSEVALTEYSDAGFSGLGGFKKVQ